METIVTGEWGEVVRERGVPVLAEDCSTMVSKLILLRFKLNILYNLLKESEVK